MLVVLWVNLFVLAARGVLLRVVGGLGCAGHYGVVFAPVVGCDVGCLYLFLAILWLVLC